MTGERRYIASCAKYLTCGADYTFPLGNGLYCLLEHMSLALSSEAWGWQEDAQATAWYVSYPIGLFDTVSAIGLISWEAEKYAQYLAWRRTYDSVSLNLNLFHYPDYGPGGGMPGDNLPGSGYGGQVTIILNH